MKYRIFAMIMMLLSSYCFADGFSNSGTPPTGNYGYGAGTTFSGATGFSNSGTAPAGNYGYGAGATFLGATGFSNSGTAPAGNYGYGAMFNIFNSGLNTSTYLNGNAIYNTHRVNTFPFINNNDRGLNNKLYFNNIYRRNLPIYNGSGATRN